MSGLEGEKERNAGPIALKDRRKGGRERRKGGRNKDAVGERKEKN